jgi:aldehyde dehydrogenase (NAD+)
MGPVVDAAARASIRAEGAGPGRPGPKKQGRSAREFFTHTTTVYLRGGQATM